MTAPRWLVQHPDDQLGTGGWVEYPDRAAALAAAGTAGSAWMLTPVDDTAPVSETARDQQLRDEIAERIRIRLAEVWPEQDTDDPASLDQVAYEAASAVAPEAQRPNSDERLLIATGHVAGRAGMLADVIAALRDHDAFVEWTQTNGPSGYSDTYLSREGRDLAARYLAGRLGAKEQP